MSLTFNRMGYEVVNKIKPTPEPHYHNRSEAQLVPIFAFLTAQNCHLNAQRNLWLKNREF